MPAGPRRTMGTSNHPTFPMEHVMKSPTLKIIAAALALAAGSALAEGDGPGGGNCWGNGEGFGPRAGYGPGAGASLTDEQRAKAAVLQEKFRETNWKTMGDMQKERFRLSELYRAAKPDARAIAEQEKKVDALREQMFKARNDHRREMQALFGRPS